MRHPIRLDVTICEAVIEAEPVTLSSEPRSSIDPLAFEELPPKEQEIIRVALTERTYRKCPAADPRIPDPHSLFAHRAGRHTGENHITYLKRDDEYYKLYVQSKTKCILGDRR